MTTVLSPYGITIGTPILCERECGCLWWKHDPADHPSYAHTTLQVLPTCPLHGDWMREHVSAVVVRWLEAAIWAAWTRAVVSDGDPGRWRIHLSNRLRPCPRAGMIRPAPERLR